MNLSKIWVVSTKSDDKGLALAQVSSLEAFRASPMNLEYSSVQWSGFGRPAVAEDLAFSAVEVKARIGDFVNPLGALNGLFQMADHSCIFTIGADSVDHVGRSRVLLFAALMDTFLVGYTSRPPIVSKAIHLFDTANSKDNYSLVEILNDFGVRSELDDKYWRIGQKDLVELIEFVQIQKLFKLPNGYRVNVERVKGNRLDKNNQRMQLRFEAQGR